MNAQNFFDTLTSNVNEYQQNSLIVKFGDLMQEHDIMWILSLEWTPLQDVKDFQTNQYYSMIVVQISWYIIITNLCILNGRNSKNNDFTCISIYTRVFHSRLLSEPILMFEQIQYMTLKQFHVGTF